LKDAAIINSGVSRWHNYYLEGLNWLVRNVRIDGIYIDDVAFDRTTMKRLRKILDRGNPGALIDLHSANQYNPRDGFASSANLYMEHFPYLNRLWFGEYFDYNSPPDYWLVEISGIPFGLMGEMLQDGGNPWRGMVYGMTNRLPWSGKNPAHLWKVWDDFGIVDSRMVGYWVSSSPVRTGHKDVLATAYVKKDRVLISLASWAKDPVDVSLIIDWKSLGIDLGKAKLYAPFIPDFQEEALFQPADRIPLEPGKGWLLILKE
ncbi:MAG: glycoside hydrolase domain-containing protein, partial [Candidatus Aminicenantales bacterium]